MDYKVLRDFLATLDQAVHLDHLDLRAHLVPPAVLVILAHQEIPEVKVFRDFQVPQVRQELLAKLVNYYFILVTKH